MNESDSSVTVLTGNVTESNSSITVLPGNVNESDSSVAVLTGNMNASDSKAEQCMPRTNTVSIFGRYSAYTASRTETINVWIVWCAHPFTWGSRNWCGACHVYAQI